MLLVVFQISFLFKLNLFFQSFNLVLALLVVVIFVAQIETVFYYLVFAGLLLDIYSGQPFGIFLISYLVTAVALEILFLNFFTNRSFYALIIAGIISILIFNATFWLMSGFLYLVGLNDFWILQFIWRGIFYQIIAMVMVLAAAFTAVNSFTKRFKPIFLK